MLKRLRRQRAEFLEEFTQPMGRSDRRGGALMSVRGRRLDGTRKSVEPMAAKLRVIDTAQRDSEQSLQQFVNQSPWEARAVRKALAGFVVEHAATGGSSRRGRRSAEVATGVGDEPREVGPHRLALSARAPNSVTWRKGTQQKLSRADYDLTWSR
jgi:hypothetical protein